MILQIFVRDDETGLLPGELRRGDVFAVHDDSYVPGGIERKTFFFVKVPDPPKITDFQTQLVRSRYGVPGTQGEDAPVILAREWKLEYWLSMTPEQVDLIDNTAALNVLPGARQRVVEPSPRVFCRGGSLLMICDTNELFTARA